MTDLTQFVKRKNDQKHLFTPGPGPLLEENIVGLGPAFGRGDGDYEAMEIDVLRQLKEMSGLPELIRLQGAGSLALEIMISNFIFGKVLLVQTGYYSDRLKQMLLSYGNQYITNLDTVEFEELDLVSGSYDWVLACVTETSRGSLQKISTLRIAADKLKAKLALDAVASFGLEADHDLADAIAFSSCKGLFGFTGGAFLAFRSNPNNEVLSFNLRLESHALKLMTGPYHAIQSLANVLPKHQEFLSSVQENKKRFLRLAERHVPLGPDRQPLLCTRVLGRVSGSSTRAILYESRLKSRDSVVSHLGEAHLGLSARGDILTNLVFAERKSFEDG